MVSRRDLMRRAGGAVIAASAGRFTRTVAGAQRSPAPAGASRPELLLFSKHLPDLGWSDVGRAVVKAGFDGVDLTVRTGGHVRPERAAEDLPRAIEAIKAEGASVPMVTTELTSAAHPTARPLLQAAARSGVRYFKTGYWRFTASPDVRAQVAAAGDALQGLAELARECGVEMGFHNHAGYIGGALWDIAPAMERLDERWAGYYFDPRHAVAEGGAGAWKAATHLVVPRLKMLALKDFYWHRTATGWETRNCPLGEGMVDWDWLASTLRAARFSGPVSLHLEYDIGGSTPVEKTERTLAAARKDLGFMSRFLRSLQP